MELNDIWPPYRLRITAGDLQLTLIRDADLPGLVDLALSGIHDPGFMPFAVPWTDADPADLPAEFVRFHSAQRAGFRPERFSLDFAVRRVDRDTGEAELVGTQSFSTHDFAITRTGETGSWLARRFQGQGIGTRMRQAVCAFAFDKLGAVQVTSGAFMDNPSSLAVSRKVGYRPNGINLMTRRGVAVRHQNLLLTPKTFVRGDPITVTGADDLRAFLGLRIDGSDDRREDRPAGQAAQAPVVHP